MLTGSISLWYIPAGEFLDIVATIHLIFGGSTASHQQYLGSNFATCFTMIISDQCLFQTHEAVHFLWIKMMPSQCDTCPDVTRGRGNDNDISIVLLSLGTTGSI